MLKLRKQKQNLHVQFKNDFILKPRLRLRLKEKVLHICNPIFGTGLASTFKPVLQMVTNKIKENDFISE